jgi:hypothetical protein
VAQNHVVVWFENSRSDMASIVAGSPASVGNLRGVRLRLCLAVLVLLLIGAMGLWRALSEPSTGYRFGGSPHPLFTGFSMDVCLAKILPVHDFYCLFSRECSP